jgi:hypothetical protein
MVRGSIATVTGAGPQRLDSLAESARSEGGACIGPTTGERSEHWASGSIAVSMLEAAPLPAE